MGLFRFLDVYGCRLADLRLVVMFHSVYEVLRMFGIGCVDQGVSVVPVVAPVGHHGFLVDRCGPASVLRPCLGYLLAYVVQGGPASGRCKASHLTAALSTACIEYVRPCLDRRSLMAI